MDILINIFFFIIVLAFLPAFMVLAQMLLQFLTAIAIMVLLVITYPLAWVYVQIRGKKKCHRKQNSKK